MISVIIPLYNKEGVVERTIRSVLEQSYRDIELIIVDDGSTDNSFAVAERVVASVPDRQEQIKLLRQENGGPSAARNTGSRNAQGEWILFLDADDELTEDALQYFADITKEHKDVDIIDCKSCLRMGSRQTLNYHPMVGNVKNPLRAFFYKIISPGSGHSIFKCEFIKQYPYNEQLRRYEDCEILLRMLQTAKVYSTDYVIEIHDVGTASASLPRKNTSQDFLGHLDFSKGGFWYKMNLYKFFLEERDNYKEDCHRLYPWLYWRYDLLLIYKILLKFKW